MARRRKIILRFTVNIFYVPFETRNAICLIMWVFDFWHVSGHTRAVSSHKKTDET